MAFEHPGEGALDYFPCRYGGSKQLFRGPQKPLDRPYSAFLGGTETYGRFVEDPFPDLVEEATGRTTVNLGCVNAGVDAFAQDPALVRIASNARVTVIQVTGAQNLSNRFYTVHPRRNDRFLKPSETMKAVFPSVDFTEFAFTRHMLQALSQRCPNEFDILVDELQTAWLARMRQLVQSIRGRIVLLWLGSTAPPDTPFSVGDSMPDPLFVDRYMLNEIVPLVDDYVEVVASSAALAAGTAGMVFSELEALAAAEAPGVMVHREAAQMLAPVITRHMG